LTLTNDINQFNSLNTEDLIDFLFTKVRTGNLIPKLTTQLNDFSSPDDLHDFITSQSELLDVPLGEDQEVNENSVRVVTLQKWLFTNKKKAGNSFFGLFLRKILISFRKHSFQQLSSLFLQTNAYRDLYLEQQSEQNTSVSMDTSFNQDEMEISSPVKPKVKINKEQPQNEIPLDLNLVPRDVAREHLLKR
jgi:hypothetical protein